MFFNTDHFYTDNAAGLLVNGISICVGLISILHVHLAFKAVAFALIAVNLGQ